MLCLQHPSSYNNPPLLTASGKSVKIHPTVKQLSVKCSNPLLRYTKECCVFWSEIETFNKKICEMEHSIKDVERMIVKKDSNTISNNDYRFFDAFDHCEEGEESYLEECRVYDV